MQTVEAEKKALTLSIQLMMVGTGMMALMPPFASIGMIAPIGILTGSPAASFRVQR